MRRAFVPFGQDERDAVSVTLLVGQDDLARAVGAGILADHQLHPVARALHEDAVDGLLDERLVVVGEHEHLDGEHFTPTGRAHSFAHRTSSATPKPETPKPLPL